MFLPKLLQFCKHVSGTVAARSAAWKVDPLFQLSKVSWPHSTSCSKDPTGMIENFSWQLWLSLKGCWQTRQNVVDNFFSSIIFCRQHEICSVSPKLSMRSCKKTVVDQKKRLICFHFPERKCHQRDLVIYHFLIDNTKYEFVAVFQNSHWSQKVADEKELSTRNNC